MRYQGGCPPVTDRDTMHQGSRTNKIFSRPLAGQRSFGFYCVLGYVNSTEARWRIATRKIKGQAWVEQAPH